MNKTTSLILLLISLVLIPAQSALSADKRIGILVFDGVLTSDITAPLEVFGIASRKSWFSDYTPVVINTENKPGIVTEEGLKLSTDSWIGENPQVDVLIVPSRYEMASLIENQPLINYIRSTATSAEWIASNCSGAFLLGEAGVLDGHKATTWAGGEKGLQRAYPAIEVQFDRNVVIDHNIITSNGSLVSYQAALMLLGKMTSMRKANEVADAIQYERFFNQPLPF